MFYVTFTHPGTTDVKSVPFAKWSEARHFVLGMVAVILPNHRLMPKLPVTSYTTPMHFQLHAGDYLITVTSTWYRRHPEPIEHTL